MNQSIQVTLDDLGRIFVPASLREKLRLSPGMRLIVEKGEKGGVQLCVESRPTTLVEKDGMLVAHVEALGDLTTAARNERDRRVFDLLQRVGL
ncbi:MAG: AbrB/MazE/SpoVT family DNA-binding domain-containing protein [Chloroflexota bacterium]